VRKAPSMVSVVSLFDGAAIELPDGRSRSRTL
jgi:hypothetical protein